MAEIEDHESDDEGRAREWMARALRAPRDPAWAADGYVSDRWMPVSPVSGRLDAFQWKVPLAELGDARDVIDSEEIEDTRPVIAAPPPPPPRPPKLPARTEDAIAPVAKPVEPPTLSGSFPKPPKIAPRVEAVIPLLQVPDDPGPDPAPDLEPEPEPPGGSRGLRLFK
jgi:HemY protein